MKKTLFIFLGFFLLLSVCAIQPVLAEESEYYYKNVQILKIFPHRLGYYVIYRRVGLKTGELYIPHEWFARTDQRAVLNRTDSNINPYLTIMTKAGEFDHIRLVVAKDINHPTWGMISPGTDITEKFKIEKLTVEY